MLDVERPRPFEVDDIHGQVVPGCVRKQSEQASEPWSFTASDSVPASSFPPWLLSMMDYKL